VTCNENGGVQLGFAFVFRGGNVHVLNSNVHFASMADKRLTKCTTNGFVGSLFSDVFFGYLYIKKIVPSPFLGRCLKYFGSKFTDSRIPGLKGESLFYT
jgi:hypothetical protein